MRSKLKWRRSIKYCVPGCLPGYPETNQRRSGEESPPANLFSLFIPDISGYIQGHYAYFPPDPAWSISGDTIPISLSAQLAAAKGRPISPGARRLQLCIVSPELPPGIATYSDDTMICYDAAGNRTRYTVVSGTCSWAGRRRR